MAVTEEPILSRFDRLDNLLRNLEGIRVGSMSNARSSPKSSCASTVSSNCGGGDHTTFCSSLDISPTRSLGKSCRPIGDVIIETQQKGTLIDRLSFMEDRVLKVWSQLEVDIEAEKTREVEDKQQQQQQQAAAAASASMSHHQRQRNSPKKAIQRFVRSCVGSKGN